MKQMSLIAGLVVIAILSACTYEKSLIEPDYERAAEINAQLGLGYMQQNRLDLAMKKLEKAISFDSKNVNANHYKAELHRRLKEYDKAKKLYENALEISPKDSALNNNYGVFLCELKDFNAAKKHFDKVIGDPLYGAKDQAYENLGLCSLAQGDLQLAEHSFRAALKYNAKLPKSLLNMAQISFDKNDTVSAFTYYGRFLSLSEQTPASLWLGFLLERARGNRDTATSYAVLLKGKYPDSQEAELLRKLEESGRKKP